MSILSRDDDDEFLYGDSKPPPQAYVTPSVTSNPLLNRSSAPPVNVSTSEGTAGQIDTDPEDAVDIGEEDVADSQRDGEESDEVSAVACSRPILHV